MGDKMNIIRHKRKRIRIYKGIKKMIAIYSVIIAVLLISLFLFVRYYDKHDLSNKKNIDNVSSFTLSSDCITKGIVKFDKIKVYRKSIGKIEEMDLEEYVKGVVSAEMPANFDIEALKAQAVAARTFAVNKIVNKCSESHGADICDTVHCQVYMDKQKRMDSWNSKQRNELYAKIVQAVNSTKGEVITYKGNIITYPQYFAISSGKTEDSQDVYKKDIPYLKSVSSKGEEDSPKYKTEKTISYREFVNIIKNNFTNSGINTANLKNKTAIISRTKSGAVNVIKIGNSEISGIKFRKMFGLNSTNFNITFLKSNIKISCTGYGHNTGMSQWGANVMAKKGVKYKKILEHYYVGTKLEKIS